MARNEVRFEIWGMDRDLSLNDIINLLNLDYNKPIDYLTEYTNLSVYDKTLQNKWLPTNNQNFTIETLTIAGQNIQYINAIGQYEDQVGPTRGIVNGTPLPREVRVFNKSINAVFFHYNGRVYCVLDVGTSQASRVRSLLFGQNRSNRIEEWGTVEFRNLDFYSLDSRFFYWIFSKRGQALNFPHFNNGQVNVVDISAVSQLADRDAYDSTSQGANVLGSLQALSGLGSNQSIYNGGFYFLKDGTFNYFMRIATDCSCIVDLSRSNIHNGTEFDLIQNNFSKAVLTIYTFLFPGLKSLFNQEQGEGLWNFSQEAEQRKQWALEVVRELCEENSIDLEELEQIFR